MTVLRRILSLAAAAFLAAGAAHAAGPSRPIFVELYTSQGCDTCPPADALLGKLAQRPDVIAISLPITYWDMLGWKDTLANDANTRRQKAYAAAMGHGGVYTPQIIVDGVTDVVGSRAAQVEAAIADRRAQLVQAQAVAVTVMSRTRFSAHGRADSDRAALLAGGAPLPVLPSAPPPAAPAPVFIPADPIVPVVLRESPQDLQIDLGEAPSVHQATVWMFRLRTAVNVNITRGENAGHAITYHNVADDVRPIGVYQGHAVSFTLPKATDVPHDAIAVVVQQGGYGHVLGAAYAGRTAADQ